MAGFAEKPRFQGAGSSQVNAAKVDTPLDRIRAHVEERGGRVTYAQGFDPDLATADPALIAEAVEVAAQADIVLVLGGLPALFESEGFDRTHLDMPDQINQLILGGRSGEYSNRCRAEQRQPGDHALAR